MMTFPPYLQDLFTSRSTPWTEADWIGKEQRCHQALIDHPEDSIGILHALKSCYYMEEKNLECIDTCEKLLALNPDYHLASETYSVMGTSYHQLYQIDKAIACFEKGHELEPANGSCLFELGEMHTELVEYDKAIAAFLRLLDMGDWEVESLENLGYLYTVKREYALALSYYKKGMELFPEEFFWVERIASTYFMDKKIAEAESWFNSLLQADPESADAYYGLGSCKQETGDYYMAMHHFHEALKINPNHARSLNNIGKLYFDHESDIKTAIRMLEKAVEVCQEEDSDILPTAYLNLKRIYKQIADEDKVDYYHRKFMESFGFGYEEVEEGGDDEEETEEEH
ncbi:MAG: tetratricopeptide repeat protein [Bacteroidia bacterium]